MPRKIPRIVEGVGRVVSSISRAVQYTPFGTSLVEEDVSEVGTVEAVHQTPKEVASFEESEVTLA